MRALIVMYIFYKLFISNKFEEAVRIISIQSRLNVSFIFSIKYNFRNLQTIFPDYLKIGFRYQVEETRYLFTYRNIKSAFFFFFFFFFVKHALE